ncbi:hypothetical protein SEA_CATERPILLAR_70 [Arthrobacter phage Caterpillar]|nr:hypothetical protein SEA_CATERPILLAR_70 [Arthrobacter phage Caterpillar]
MASNTVEEPLAIIRVECCNPLPHDPHTWREGFLWHRRRVCGGVAEWFRKFEPRPQHRHFFQLLEASNAYLTWECEECPTTFVQARFVWVSQTVYGRRLGDNPWEI